MNVQTKCWIDFANVSWSFLSIRSFYSGSFKGSIQRLNSYSNYNNKDSINTVFLKKIPANLANTVRDAKKWNVKSYINMQSE